MQRCQRNDLIVVEEGTIRRPNMNQLVHLIDHGDVSRGTVAQLGQELRQVFGTWDGICTGEELMSFGTALSE